ncbi:SLBB domain-containing protein [Comamonas testosteroni]|uniref:Polysaccharide export protein n=1 Tax=Comamonas testosteroni (strain DSM 14576 / KF-1) TaxID=399795 RepID=B7X5C7_COMTK|nr:SLBB domain-containing protein [Comamonas testosteroni]EED66919.1 polysaccharide export protein [Comamonas testosteroni KF-1]WQG65131.1 SLBB domain-containing protein [Comamonas testosteroni]
MQRFIARTCISSAVAVLLTGLAPAQAQIFQASSSQDASASSIDPFQINQALGLVPSGGSSNEASASRSGAAVPMQSPVLPQAPQTADYTANLNSDVFGANLFTGNFARAGATQFNPDYLVAVGDRIHLRLWGGFTFDSVAAVDPQGNIFLPQVGPIKVLGIANKNLQQQVEAAVRRVFRANVYSYASLAAAQPVRIFVGGNVMRPGLYNGTSMDSLLNYLDQAGGIDPERGSFLTVQVKRGASVRATFNLYDFLLKGQLPLLQLNDGDVIFVPPIANRVRVSGLVNNAKRFEFSRGSETVAELMQLAKPQAQATHVRIARNTGTVKNTEYYPLQEANALVLQNGDELEFTADKKPGTITVRVEGEHMNSQEYVLPYGTRLGSLMQSIQTSADAEPESIQLFRQSVKDRQKEMLATSLRSLETALLTARSGSSEEARLRKDEADLTLQWVERAKKVEPTGQVQIAQAAQRDNMLLENGDVIRIPRKDGLVLVSGEVLFPNAVAFDGSLSLKDYIDRAGGFTQTADAARVVVAHRDGAFEQVDTGKLFENTRLKAGDQVLVLPKVDEKKRQFWKDITQIMYQIAIGAKVVFGL